MQYDGAIFVCLIMFWHGFCHQCMVSDHDISAGYLINRYWYLYQYRLFF